MLKLKMIDAHIIGDQGQSPYFGGTVTCKFNIELKAGRYAITIQEYHIGTVGTTIVFTEFSTWQPQVIVVDQSANGRHVFDCGNCTLYTEVTAEADSVLRSEIWLTQIL